MLNNFICNRENCLFRNFNAIFVSIKVSWHLKRYSRTSESNLNRFFKLYIRNWPSLVAALGCGIGIFKCNLYWSIKPSNTPNFNRSHRGNYSKAMLEKSNFFHFQSSFGGWKVSKVTVKPISLENNTAVHYPQRWMNKRPHPLIILCFYTDESYFIDYLMHTHCNRYLDGVKQHFYL